MNNRRSFLGLGLAAVAAPFIVPRASLMAMPRRRLWVPREFDTWMQLVDDLGLGYRVPCVPALDPRTTPLTSAMVFSADFADGIGRPVTVAGVGLGEQLMFDALRVSGMPRIIGPGDTLHLTVNLDLG